MISKGTKVKITGSSHYTGKTGIVVSSGSSMRDGDYYKITLDLPYIVMTVKVKAKFVQVLYPESLERKAAKILSTKRIVEPTEYNKYKASVGKNVLISLIFEEDGVTYANVVFQGEYAVLPLADLEVRDGSFGGIA